MMPTRSHVDAEAVAASMTVAAARGYRDLWLGLIHLRADHLRMRDDGLSYEQSIRIASAELNARFPESRGVFDDAIAVLRDDIDDDANRQQHG